MLGCSDSDAIFNLMEKGLARIQSQWLEPDGSGSTYRAQCKSTGKDITPGSFQYYVASSYSLM